MIGSESKRTVVTLVDSTEQNNEVFARTERSAALATLAITREEQRSERENDEKCECNSALGVASPLPINSVKLRVGEVVFEAEKETLLSFDHTYFHGMLSGPWQPDADGAYCIDRPAMGFDRILDYLRSGKLSVEGLTQLEEECVYSHLDYFLIPYKREWKYNTQSVIEGVVATCVCELKDGRLCGAYENDVIVWNNDTSAIDMTLTGHTNIVNGVMQLHDGRLCSCSDDNTIKLWNIDSGLCELSLTGHTDVVYDIIQLLDGRICSGSRDRNMKVWNMSTGVCEISIETQCMIYSIIQFADGRICCSGDDGFRGTPLYVSNAVNGDVEPSWYDRALFGKCERSWEGHTEYVYAIVHIDDTRICSSSADCSIIVWNIATGKCVRTLEGHTGEVTSMVLMQDGRLCSGSYDCSLKLWNLETGVCENTLDSKNKYWQVLQLEDGRLLSTQYGGSGRVEVWS